MRGIARQTLGVELGIEMRPLTILFYSVGTVARNSRHMQKKKEGGAKRSCVLVEAHTVDGLTTKY